MMIKSIIFDLGRVYGYDTDPQLYRDIAKLLNRNVELVKEVVEKIIPPFQRGDIDCFEISKILAKELNTTFPEDKVEEIWRDSYIRNAKTDEKVESLVKKLKNNGYILAILSNTEHHHAKFNRETNRFKDFDVVVLSCEVGTRKPEPEIYNLTHGKLREIIHHLKPNECVLIDDKENYLVPAREFGWHAILYQNDVHPISYLESVLKKLGVRSN